MVKNNRVATSGHPLLDAIRNVFLACSLNFANDAIKKHRAQG